VSHAIVLLSRTASLSSSISIQNFFSLPIHYVNVSRFVLRPITTTKWTSTCLSLSQRSLRSIQQHPKAPPTPVQITTTVTQPKKLSYACVWTSSS
jgi:hypothetical protein